MKIYLLLIFCLYYFDEVKDSPNVIKTALKILQYQFFEKTNTYSSKIMSEFLIYNKNDVPSVFGRCETNLFYLKIAIKLGGYSTLPVFLL